MTSENNILPKLGHVKKTCQQWGVREDGALAQRLQSQEINEYYNRNKERNAIVREDFPKALTEQKKEEEVAHEVETQYRQYLENLEKADRDLAEQMERNLKIERLRNEEVEANKAKEIARRIQRREQQAERERLAAIDAQTKEAVEFARQLHILEQQNDISQGERDRLLAIQAQNEELAEKDRMMAIQAQDEELAKLLQERERKRAKRSKEKYRLKKSQQQQQQQQQQLDELSAGNHMNSSTIHSNMTTSSSINSTSSIHKDNSNANQLITVTNHNNNYDLIDDTYSDPIDLIRTNEIVDNRNGAIPKPKALKPKPKRPIPNIPFPYNNDETEDDDDDTYALPIDVKGFHSIPNVREHKKPILLPKLNSLHDFQTKQQPQSHHPQRNNQQHQNHHDLIRFDYPPTPNSLDGPSSLIGGNGGGSIDSKQHKKDKKEKCTQQ